MLLLFVGLLSAAPLRLTPGAGADLQLLPTIQPGLAEVMAYEVTEDLRAQLKDRRFEGIRKIRATNMGAHTWVINMVLDRPDTSLQLQVEKGVWTGIVSKKGPADHLYTEAPSFLELAKNPEQAHDCKAPRLPVTPLVGDDMSYGLDPADFVPRLPRWQEAEPAESNWQAVSDLRAALFVRHEKAQLAERYYRLGALHRDLGHAREAAYYFSIARDKGGERGLIELQRAGALLSANQWDAARTAAWNAWKLGAPDDSVLEVLGVIALATHHPNAGSTALVMAHTTARPDSLALAGAMLLEAGCPQEAIPILRTAGRYLNRRDPLKAAQSRLMLVDALILSGQMETAAEVLGDLTEKDLPPEQAGVLRARNRLLTLLRLTPDKWASMIPGLNTLRNQLGAEAAESLYLLGQIEEWLGEDREAIDAYLNLVDHHRHLAEGAPAKRLVAAWTRQNKKMLEEGKEIDAMKLHTAIWRPAFAEMVEDAEGILQLAGAYRSVGLQYRSMNLLGLAAEVQGRKKEDDQHTILQIAELYLEMKHPDLAADALEVLQSRSLTSESVGKMQVLQGRIAEGEEARKIWLEASKNPAVTTEALARIAMMDALNGVCNLDPMAAALESPELSGRLGEGVLRTLYARCLGQSGNAEGSAVAGFNAAQKLSDPDSRRYAGWLSANAAEAAKVAPPGDPAEVDPPDIWTLLSREEKQQGEFKEKLAALQE